ncbi:hypothetical protein [Actinoplanes solisilvae]|uniref:hypothetical protein n=1 Tax=Actinoplanes solisilvae TaxID=2486853 RepID=UPI000FDA1E56|nr:hypothetical protein [Actinoplanes solisilvae]
MFALVVAALTVTTVSVGSPASAATASTSRANSALQSVVPGAWRNAIPNARATRLISGKSSTSAYRMGIWVSRFHAAKPAPLLRHTMAHEFGHHIAFYYGSQVVYGAAPTGFPQGVTSVETWADCVASAFSGVDKHGTNVKKHCSRAGLRWTKAWLSKGPYAHPRTNAAIHW